MICFYFEIRRSFPITCLYWWFVYAHYPPKTFVVGSGLRERQHALVEKAEAVRLPPVEQV